MGNALWLLVAAPQWFLSAMAAPFSAGVLTVIPALGVVCLVLGAGWGLVGRRIELLWFLVPVAGSAILVFVAGLFRGKVAGTVERPLALAFLGLEAAVAIYFVFRLKRARWPAAALAIFTVAYAWFASFVAAMSFTDTWL